jgi:hypothetical protein
MQRRLIGTAAAVGTDATMSTADVAASSATPEPTFRASRTVLRGVLRVISRSERPDDRRLERIVATAYPQPRRTGGRPYIRSRDNPGTLIPPAATQMIDRRRGTSYAGRPTTPA